MQRHDSLILGIHMKNLDMKLEIMFQNDINDDVDNLKKKKTLPKLS